MSERASEAPGPYAGLRVFDLSHVIAGPLCTRMLADLGADVVRVEQRGGDLMRQTPVFFGGDNSSAYAQYNCGKRSIGLDLKHERGRGIALDLVAWADVVVENFKPGTLDRLGLSYDVMRERNERVILCSLSTFGQTGPHAHRSGFGLVAEAFSGLMDLTRYGAGAPTHFGTPLADMISGIHGVAAIGAALHHRERTGTGTHIDLSAFDAMFCLIDQGPAMAAFSRGERRFEGYGRRHATSVPSGVVEVANGEHVAYGMTGTPLFTRMAHAMGRPDLVEDERFAETDARVANAPALYDIIEEWARTFPTADALVEHLARFGLTAARVRTLDENLHDPHLVARGTLSPVTFPEVGEVLLQTTPYVMSGCTVRPGRPAGHIGEHTDEVLRDCLGLDDAGIAELHACGAVHGGRRASAAA
jgi:crotonobetainyl-CoA:carnitine CoA-transferase CaiB-like acyl-CoA transferase